MVAPKLRFKEFDGDWSRYKIAEVTEYLVDGTHFSPKTTEGEFKYITSKNIRNDGLDLTNISYISKDEHEKIYKRCKVQLGDILLTKDGANTGNCCLNTLDEEFSLLSSVAVLRGKKDSFNNNFILQILQSDLGQDTIISSMSGQAITRITLAKLKDYSFFFPELTEQTQITSFLSAVDEKISQLTQKHALLSQYKQGMMQKLFSQQIRFKADDGSKFGKWVNKKIIEIADYVDFRGKTPKKVDNGILLVTAKNIRFGYIDYEVSREYIGSDDFEEVMRRGCAKIGDVLITTEAPLGNVASVDREDIALAQRVIKYRGKEGILNNAFLKQKFLSEDFQALIASKATGGTVQGIKGSTLHNLEIYIPQDIEEQTKIANFLSSIDQKIEVVAQQIEQAKQWKKGLLQQMFV